MLTWQPLQFPHATPPIKRSASWRLESLPLLAPLRSGYRGEALDSAGVPCRGTRREGRYENTTGQHKNGILSRQNNWNPNTTVYVHCPVATAYLYSEYQVRRGPCDAYPPLTHTTGTLSQQPPPNPNPP